MVVWIIGLSGAGKSTLANAVVAKVRAEGRKVVLIDGDVIREVFGNDLGHTLDDRRKNADRICRLCKFLEDEGIDVVCSILSIFRESRTWNRKHLKDYYEVFIDVPIDQLIERDSKGIYKKYLDGEIRNVTGMDLEFPRPEHADLTIRNTQSENDLLGYAEPLAKKITGGAS